MAYMLECPSCLDRHRTETARVEGLYGQVAREEFLEALDKLRKSKPCLELVAWMSQSLEPDGRHVVRFKCECSKCKWKYEWERDEQIWVGDGK